MCWDAAHGYVLLWGGFWGGAFNDGAADALGITTSTAGAARSAFEQGAACGDDLIRSFYR
ncbi:MAG: hypothetical protein ABIP94_19345 [Planctomycetota bacterium]